MADKYGFVLQGDDEANTLETRVMATSMQGDHGSDTFVFQAHSGRDTIHNFEDTGKAQTSSISLPSRRSRTMTT